MKDSCLITFAKIDELSEDALKHKTFRPEYDESAKFWALRILEGYGPLLNRAKVEIQGLFTKEEACLICDVLNGLLYIYSDNGSAKESLVIEVIDAIAIDRLDEKWEVDKEALLKKLNGLYEIHAYVVILLANQLWDEEQSEDFFPTVKRLFGIG